MNLEQGVLQIHIEDIIPNRFQPRLNFDEQGLKELADSIKEHGIIQPLVLRKLGDKYEIIAGERRYKAAQIAGLQTVPAVIANIDDNKSAEVALVENVQRRDLTAIEEARSYKNLLDKGYLTQDQLAKRMGLSQPSIANKLRLLNLDEEVQQALLEEKISERHARTLLTIEDKAVQREWLHRIINERLTVRQLDLEIKKLKEQENTYNPTGEIPNSIPTDVPIVESSPSVEDIKANSYDLFDTSRKMSTEDIMAPQQFVDEVVEPLDNNESSETSGGFTTIPEDTTPEYQEPVQQPMPDAKVPEYQIATPASTNNFVPSAGIKEPSGNKFFDFTNLEESENDPLLNSPVDNSQPTNTERTLELFDSPGESTESDFVSITPQREEPIPTIYEPPSKEEIKPKPMDFTKDDYGPKELSNNNKFFTPVQEPREIEMVEAQNNQEVDPMSAVSNLTAEEKHKEEQEKDLKYAIGKVRECIQSLGDEGFFISVEEIDFEEDYQITIQIDKDNY
jgi:ParB family chromosome partitioning protein